MAAEHIAWQVSSDFQVAIDDDRNRIWNPRLLAARFFVANSVSIDHLAICIGQQRKSDFVLLGEFAQHFYRVIADANDLDVGSLKFLNVLLQLNQLRHAKSSPVSRSIKMGDIIHALRVAVTGKAVGLGMFDTVEIVGRESCLARIDRACQRA